MPTIFRFGGYRKPTPSLFGDGSDGDFYLAAGETHTEPVTVPHQSVVEKNYKSLTIEAGALYQCSDCNAGLVIRVKGDCTIHGTIDQSGKAPKTNPNNNYPYPEELVCGDGGDGGTGGRAAGESVITAGLGGSGMPARAYGGGYGAGGGSGARVGRSGSLISGRSGGDADTITIDVPTESMFVTDSGEYGGGGQYSTGIGDYGYNRGGNGNYGGGIITLYVGGELEIDGAIKCDGLNGTPGGSSQWNTDNLSNSGGGGGGAGGGGCIYIVHNGSSTITGQLTVYGGTGGDYGRGYGNGSGEGYGVDGTAGENGGNGAVVTKQYVKGMTA